MLQNSPIAIQFADKLIEEKGLYGLDTDVKEQLRNDLLERLETRINRKIVQSLNEDQLAEFEHIIDSNSLDNIQPFLYKYGVNVDSLIAQAMGEFREIYLEN